MRFFPGDIEDLVIMPLRHATLSLYIFTYVHGLPQVSLRLFILLDISSTDVYISPAQARPSA